MDYRQCKPPFDRDGYVVVRQFLTRDELSELRSQIRRFIREVAPSLPDTQVFHAIGENGQRRIRLVLRMNCDAFFEGYRSHPKWRSLAQALLGEAAEAS